MSEKRCAGIDCLVTLSGILLVMYVVQPYKIIFVKTTFLWLLVTSLVQYQENELPLRNFWMRGFLKTCKLLFPFLVPLCFGIFLVGLLMGNKISVTTNKFGGLFYYYGFAFLQGFLLQVHFLPRLEKIFSKKQAMHACAGLFMFCHIPNPVLMAVTWAGAYPLLWAYKKYKNLPSVSLAQWLVGASLSAFLPAWLTGHNRVGIGFFAYYGYGYQEIWRTLNYWLGI